MMINKRLINTVKESKGYIYKNVGFQWLGLVANIVIIFQIAGILQMIFNQRLNINALIMKLLISAICIGLRFIFTALSYNMSYKSSKLVKKRLRDMMYRKLLKLGSLYQERVATSELIQVFVEGVDQLETYFGSYLPQFFYSMLAPFTLFVVMLFINIPSAIILFVCVPLIPITIALIQTFAKKLLAKYWSQYTMLGDSFLENLQGLTTLKIYQADEFKNQEMNKEAEHFRVITMKVLSMQLNSIIIMDVIAYGGAAIGIIVATLQLQAGNINFMESIVIILLAAEFFIPMRLLGSYFHIAMNGMAASDKIFKLLDIEDNAIKQQVLNSKDINIQVKNVSFAYNAAELVLDDINMQFDNGSFNAIVGESGCGKSTLAALLMGLRTYQGDIQINNIPLKEISEKSLYQAITYIGHNAYLFKGSVKENLLMGNKQASDEALWLALEKTQLKDFLMQDKGLETLIDEKGQNLSGGQRQRLALARCLLHDSPLYIFDEATSNIDVESENAIMSLIYELAKTKSIILISHRLENVVKADNIYVMKAGKLVEAGNHNALLEINNYYRSLWDTQQALESYAR